MRKEFPMGKIINIEEINRAAMDDREDVFIDLCRVFDHESYFDPVFDPPQSFLDYCKKYWEDYYNADEEGRRYLISKYGNPS